MLWVNQFCWGQLLGEFHHESPFKIFTSYFMVLYAEISKIVNFSVFMVCDTVLMVNEKLLFYVGKHTSTSDLYRREFGGKRIISEQCSSP